MHHLLVVDPFIVRAVRSLRKSQVGYSRRAVSRITPSLLVLAAVAALAAGCGAGKSSVGASAANCLNGAGFLVQSRGKAVEGQSPAGVAFTLTLYPGRIAAQAAAARKPAKTTAVVGRGLVDVGGNPRPYAGAQGVRMSRAELGEIGRCIRKARG